MEKNLNDSRRKFLKASLITGAVAATGFGTLKVMSEDKAPKTGEKVRLLSPDGKIVEVDSSEINPTIPASVHQHIREGVPGKKFVMVIDLSRCKNAGKCRKACSKMHYLPQQRSYVKVER